MKTRSAIFLLLLISVFSCKKHKGDVIPANPGSDTTTNILSPNTHIVDTAAIQEVSDNSVILLKSKTDFTPKAGDILLANPTATNVYGFLRKITSISENSTQVICNTEQSNLNDAFDQLNFNINYSDSFSSVRTNTPLSNGSQLTFEFKDDGSIADGIEFKGEIKISIPSVVIKYQRIKGSLLPENILIRADFNTEGSSMEITNKNNSSITVGPKILTDWDDLPLIYVPIPIPVIPFGVIVIDIPFAQHLQLQTLPLTISGKAKWATLPALSATLGAKYENSTWSNLSALKVEGSATPLSKGDFSPSLSLDAKVVIATPEYDITPYKIDALKAFFKIPNELDLTLQTAQPNYSLKYKLDLAGGVKQEFYTGVKQEYSITGNIYSQTLLEGNWGTTPPSLETNSVSSITANSAISGGNITDSGGTTVTARGVCWGTSENPVIDNNPNITSDGTGTGSFVSNITGLIADTTYYVRAYATNSAGTAYGNEVSFTTAANQIIHLQGNYRLTAYTQTFSLGFDLNLQNDTGTIDVPEGTYPATLSMNGTTLTCTSSFDYTPFKDHRTYVFSGQLSGHVYSGDVKLTVVAGTQTTIFQGTFVAQ